MRKTIGRVAAAIALVLATVVSTALPSQAATSQWYDSKPTNQPVIYQTNLIYQGAPFNAPSGTPSTGSVNSLQYQWNLLDTPPSGTTLRVWLCAGASGTDNCARVNSDSVASTSGSGTLTATGFAPNASWHYVVALVAPTTYVLKPYPVNSSFYSLQVNYTY